MDFEDDEGGQLTAGPDVETPSVDGQSPESHRALLAQLTREIKLDRRHHEKAFQRMKRDQLVATWGADETWPDDNYKANICGRHVKQKTAALYAKNPKAGAKRRETLDFAVWDENPASLQLAMQALQMGQQAAAAGAVEMPQGFAEAQALIADFQQGMARRKMYDRIGKTLQVMFAYYMSEQKPLDFKRGMKQCVRRACTTGVGYVELGFQRETGPRVGLTDELADARARLDHLRSLGEQLMEGDFDDTSSEAAELELSVKALMSEPEIVLREGLVVDFPSSTAVIPDRFCKSLDGFIGARHLTIEYNYTVEDIREKFNVEVSTATSRSLDDDSQDLMRNSVLDDDYQWAPFEPAKDNVLRVWKVFHKKSGLVYWIAEGHPDFLQEPAQPEVFVEDFWPVYALTFNAVENEKELFPPSDVSLMLDMQREHNRSRQGMREHRDAARPRYVAGKGSFGSEEDTMALRELRPFEMTTLNLPQGAKISDVLQVVPVPGVDPNLYQTEQFFSDTQVVVGTQESSFGGLAKATATESAIAANATTSSDGSSIDDLDSFLTVIARAAGQIMQREVSEETARKIAGPGAMWPETTLAEIAGEIQLEVAAGSTGKPNQAVEINNWKQLLPLLLQMGSIDPVWLARETLRRLDDRMDLTDAIAAGIPSIVAQNQLAGAAGGAAPAAAPENAPSAQGPQGANNAPQPPGGEGGSEAAFGSNQV